MRANINPVGAGKLSCIIFPINHAPKIKMKPSNSSIFDDLEGSTKLSIHGINPFLLNVNRYHEIYINDSPIRPKTHIVNDSEYNCPGNEI